MRSVNKEKQETKTSNSKQTSTLGLTGGQVIELVSIGAEVVTSAFNFFTEIEKTKQIAIDAQVRIKESDNHLASSLAKFEKDMLQIQKEYELESQKLQNEFDLKMKQLSLVEKMIDKIDKLEITINIYQEKEGMTSSIVMKLFDQLHQQKLTQINALSNLGQL